MYGFRRVFAWRGRSGYHLRVQETSIGYWCMNNDVIWRKSILMTAVLKETYFEQAMVHDRVAEQDYGSS